MDLSAYADADGAPEMHAGVIANGKLFILLQRLEYWAPSERKKQAKPRSTPISSRSIFPSRFLPIRAGGTPKQRYRPPFSIRSINIPNNLHQRTTVADEQKIT